VYISAGQVIDLRNKDVYARVVQPGSPLSTPLRCLGHSSGLADAWHHAQESPSISLARHGAVIVAAGHCNEKVIRNTFYVSTMNIYKIYDVYAL
jgi:hypothetical protein